MKAQKTVLPPPGFADENVTHSAPSSEVPHGTLCPSITACAVPENSSAMSTGAFLLWIATYNAEGCGVIVTCEPSPKLTLRRLSA